LLQAFSINHLSKPLIFLVAKFQIFSKIRADIHNSKCTTSLNDIGDICLFKIFRNITFYIFVITASLLLCSMDETHQEPVTLLLPLPTRYLSSDSK
jgi:hypothetical protein